MTASVPLGLFSVCFNRALPLQGATNGLTLRCRLSGCLSVAGLTPTKRDFWAAQAMSQTASFYICCALLNIVSAVVMLKTVQLDSIVRVATDPWRMSRLVVCFIDKSSYQSMQAHSWNGRFTSVSVHCSFSIGVDVPKRMISFELLK